MSGGVPLFAGSRVPLSNRFDYLTTGTKTLQDFCEDYRNDMGGAANRDSILR